MVSGLRSVIASTASIAAQEPIRIETGGDIADSDQAGEDARKFNIMLGNKSHFLQAVGILALCKGEEHISVL